MLSSCIFLKIEIHINNNMNIVKVCKTHGDLIETQVNRRKPPRKEIICKLCDSEKQKIRRLNNPEKYRLHREKYRYLDRTADTKELTCCRCNSTKSISEFNDHMFRIRYPYCTDCSRAVTKASYSKPEAKMRHRKWYKEKYEDTAENARLLKLYGITLDQYNSMLEQQEHKCEICKSPETAVSRNGYTLRLAIDHNHLTGAIRSLLCFRCNRGIGYFEENPKLIKEILKYLKKHE